MDKDPLPSFCLIISVADTQSHYSKIGDERNISPYVRQNAKGYRNLKEQCIRAAKATIAGLLFKFHFCYLERPKIIQLTFENSQYDR